MKNLNKLTQANFALEGFYGKEEKNFNLPPQIKYVLKSLDYQVKNNFWKSAQILIYLANQT